MALRSNAKSNKSLIVFCDGTWNKADQKSLDNRPCPTNVAKLFEATADTDSFGGSQIVHYIPGVGTRFWERLRGGGFGYGISDNIKSGYKFICSNYTPGDRIYLFGFSRGAYTARSLAGLINNLGILRRTNFDQIDFAYDKYRDKTPEWAPDGSETIKFRTDYTWFDSARKVSLGTVTFLGVWDTVGALGAPYGALTSWIVDKLFKCSYHNVDLNVSIDSAGHALARHEHRWPFRPSHLGSLVPGQNPANFEEKWFDGAHSDVGGGYPETGLSDVALQWMADSARKRGMGILDFSRLPDPNLNWTFDPKVGTAPPTRKNDEPHNSQTILYRLATLAYVKIPATLGLPWPKIEPEKLARINWKGDYLRKET